MKSDILILQVTTVWISIIFSILIWIEVKRLKNMITPFVFATIPFILIFILNNFVLIYFRFPPISLKSQLFISFCLLVIFLVGYLVSKFYKRITPESKQVFQGFADEFNKFVPFIIGLSWFVIVMVIHRSMSLMTAHGGFSYFGNQEYEDQMIVGFVAHLVQLGKVCFLLLIFTFRKSRFKIISLITLIFLGIAIASVQVKYHIIFIILMAFLFYTFNKSVKKQIRILVISGLLIFILFNAFWIMLTLAWGTFGFSRSGVWEFLLKQTLNYFVTGPIVLNTWLTHPAVKPDWTLLIVFLNFFYVIIGNPLRLSAVPLVNLNFQQTAPGLYSNVGTAFGVYYLIGGFSFTIFMVILSALLSYIFYFSMIKKYNPYFLFLTLLFLTFNLLSFFVQYFTLLSTYEITVLFFGFILFFRLIKYSNKLINVTNDITKELNGKKASNKN